MRIWKLIAVLLIFVWQQSAAADEIEVDVQLVLAVDVSRSMSANELEIQRRGYAEALASPEVADAIRKGLLGRIAVTYVEWAGVYSQRTIVDWTLISSGADAAAFAAKLTARFDPALRRTSISGVLDEMAKRFDGNGYTSNRRIIDVSGDGPNNQGRPVLEARADVLAKGIVINGLPLMTKEGLGARWHLDDLDDYYRHCVIGGPAAFVIPVLEWSQFPAAVRQKLILELAGRTPPERARVWRTSDGAGSKSYDCLIGEKIWQRFIDTYDLP
ncbi:MAG: DUF1194 domain-containing protein [Pseudomonadota bacterium]